MPRSSTRARSFAAAAFAVAAGAACAPPAPELVSVGPLVDKVDPTIGTGGFAFAYGASFLGAAAPHGLVKAGPDTTGSFGEVRFVHTSGNWAEDPTILCFSHLHLQGTGLPDGGVIAMMPTTSFDAAHPRAVQYAATRDRERARAGSYAVHLVEPDVSVELAAPGPHVAAWRVTFPDGTADAVVVVDLFRTLVEGTVDDAHYDVDGARITGTLHTEGSLSPAGGYDVFFALESAASFTAADTGFGAALHFGPRDASSPVELRVGLSLVDVDGAARNLEAELPSGTAYAASQEQARAAWDAILSPVKVSVADPAAAAGHDVTMLASALYRSFLMPDVESDVDGRFRGPDGGVHHADGFRMMTDLSLWDTYRTVQPLYSLVAPADAHDVAKSIAVWTELLGHGPLWPMATGDASVMIGSPGEVVLADALARGDIAADDPDVVAAWDILRGAALDAGDPPSGRGGRGDVMAYDAQGGWVPSPLRAPVSATLEYAEDDTALARFADALGHDDDAARLRARSTGWRELFDADSGFLRARDADGAFTIAESEFAPEHFSDDYVEADAWQSLFPLDDVEGIRAVYGGDDGAAARLRDLFDRTRDDWDTRASSSASTLGVQPLPFHWQGNEPSLHVSSLAYELGDDALASSFVSWVMSTQYGPGQDGLPGNDDGGALSSWWALAAFGLHPVPGSADWVVGAPMFPRVDVRGLTVTRSGDGGVPKTRTLDGAVVGARVGHLGAALDVELRRR